ncbi:MFS transporter, partial [Nesterenkonia lacusekhoensis]
MTTPALLQTTAAPLGPRQTAQLAASGLVLIAVAYGLARFAYGLFVPAFRAEFGLDPGVVGLIGSSSYVAYCLAIYPAMMLTPRLGSRTMVVITGTLATLGTALVGLAPHAAVLAVGVVLGGMSTGLASPPLAHAVSARVAWPHRDRVQTIINAGTGLGVAVSGPVALVTLAHWRSAWLIFAAVALLATLWAAQSVPH